MEKASITIITIIKDNLSQSLHNRVNNYVIIFFKFNGYVMSFPQSTWPVYTEHLLVVVVSIYNLPEIGTP